MPRALALVLVALFVLPRPTSAQPAPLAGLDAWIEQERQHWRIPGMAVGIVRNDSLVYARGFGVLGLEDPRPVDGNTLFGVASTTKAMTAGAIALLVDEGRVHWDDPVVEHLPEFALADPWVSRNVTIRDLLTHQVGVGRMTGNRLRYLPRRTRGEVLYRMRYHEPEAPFRSDYVYSNVMYMVAGEVVRAVSGVSWDDFLLTRLFQPLGMSRSNTTVDAIASGENAAWPHQEIDGAVVGIPRRNFDVVGASASVNTSIRDMAQWIRLHLGEPGVHDGRRILSDSVMREMHSAQVALAGSSFQNGAFRAYGLGWSLADYRGRTVAQHGGATDGMNTHLVLMPSENLGVVVMTNTFNSLMYAVANRILDAHLGIDDPDWGAVYRDNYRRAYERAQARRDSIHDARVAGTAPTLPLDAYAGSYVDSLYADAEVRREGERLVLEFWGDPDMTADLEHWHHDTFRVVWRNRAMREEWVWFTLGSDGAVDALHMQWTLRPQLLQVGAYPTDYYRVARMERTAPAGAPIRIGATMSETGSYATQGIPARNGYTLCQKDINEQGGIVGRSVEFLIYDDRSEAEAAIALYEKLITEDRVDAVMGPYGSTLTEAVAPVTERHRQVLISPLAATSSIWEQGRRYLFMVLPPAELFLAGLIDMAADRGLGTVAIIQEDALFPRAAGAGAVERARAQGMDVVLHETYRTGTTDFANVLARVRAANADVLGMAASSLGDFITVARQMKDHGIDVKMFGTSGAVAEFQEALGADAEFAYGLSAWEPSLPNPGLAEFVRAYQREFNQAPSFHAAGAYGSCQLFMEAARRAGSLDADALREQLLKLETRTVFGEFAVDERGYQTANRGLFIQWQDGEKVVVWPEDLATAQPRFPTPPWNERD
jgi:CubicO group peptidase (beta-lactamase class C family)/ABC-type branched-subunit amino acid transport system substrate-binding protein